MPFQPRFLPLFAAATAVLLFAKLANSWLSSSSALALALAEAQPKAGPAEPKAPEQKGGEVKAGEVKAGEEKLAGKAPEAGKPPEAAPEAGSAAATGEVAEASIEGARKSALPTDPLLMSPGEIELLQTLSKRRDEIEKRAGEVEQRDALLQAAEQRLNEKIARLQGMQKEIDGAFKKQDLVDQEKIASLVKIYENMKPKEAARIFEQLDLPVLLEVVGHMKEQKSAPILASMEPSKAKALTLALAEHPRVQAKP